VKGEDQAVLPLCPADACVAVGKRVAECTRQRLDRVVEGNIASNVPPEDKPLGATADAGVKSAHDHLAGRRPWHWQRPDLHAARRRMEERSGMHGAGLPGERMGKRYLPTVHDVVFCPVDPSAHG
jgi:hypothetical protein